MENKKFACLKEGTTAAILYRVETSVPLFLLAGISVILAWEATSLRKGAPEVKSEKFRDLVALVDRLRSPQGCPWDREQTFETLKPMMLEEAYEVLDALDSGNRMEFSAELGDLLFQIVFLSKLAEEEGSFGVGDVIESIIAKMVRRHPHIFGQVRAETSQQVVDNWETIKRAEKAGRVEETNSILAGVPAMSALLTATRISRQAARAGFDWSHVDEIILKLHEEIDELKRALKKGSEGAVDPEVEAEVGDLLFVAVNIARFLGFDPETALRKTNQKFVRRFQYIEERLREAGKDIKQSNIEEMERLWQEAKNLGVESK
jgi:tetrapyrrole methylase family protein/MazG family protein